ncbi:MAG TPA: hemolysin family protein [Solirubrobacteraceae bacterium]
MNWIYVAAAAVLIALNAFFVIAEYALVRARHSRLELAAEQGLRGARLALRQLESINEYISTCQVGNTMASIGIGALGEPALADVLKGAIGSSVAHDVAIAIAVVVSYLLITSTQITAGEMVPKLYAIDRAETVARRIARPLQTFRIIFHPLIVSLTVVSNAMLGVLGVDPQRRIARGGSPDELKRLIRDSQAGGMLEANEATMLSGVFHLHEQEARQVMTPIPAVVTVDLAEDVQTALRRCIESGHTRLPVTEDENQDRIRGVVHATGLARRLLEVGPAASIRPLVRDAPIVPESKPLDDLLAELQRQRTALAVVADEYGRVMGIVTIEDIVEEVVGEIVDETDPAAGDIRQLPDGDWFVRGHVPVADLADYGIELPGDSDAYNSIGGLVFNELGRLPKRGDKIDVDGYELRVESVRENRIVLVRVRRRAAVVEDDEAGSAGAGETA